MFINCMPAFERGSILKKEMLENLRDYPRDLMNIFYKDASDGIISGCDIKIDGYEIIISEGILKHKGIIYTLNQSFSIPYENYSKEMILKIRFLADETDNSFLKLHSEIILDENLNISDEEIELCRFKLKEGAKLRENYNDFADFSTEYNTINLLHIKYSGNEETTLHPKVIKNFAQALIKYGKDSEDLLFSMLCLNSKLIEKPLIIRYIKTKHTLEDKKENNFDIYKVLLKIYKGMKDGKKQEPVSRQRPNVILVD